MKKIISLVILLFIIGCSQSDSAQNGDIARRFTSCFAIKGNYLYGVDQMKLNVFSLIDSEKPVKLRDFYMVLILKPCFHNAAIICLLDLEMECLSIRSAILKTQQNCQAYSTLPFVIQSQ
jgi:hypothetical protein